MRRRSDAYGLCRESARPAHRHSFWVRRLFSRELTLPEICLHVQQNRNARKKFDAAAHPRRRSLRKAKAGWYIPCAFRVYPGIAGPRERISIYRLSHKGTSHRLSLAEFPSHNLIGHATRNIFLNLDYLQYRYQTFFFLR